MSHSQDRSTLPHFQKSGKRRRNEKEETGKKTRLQSSNRQAPEIADVAPAAIKAQMKKRGSLLNKRKLEEAKPNLENRGSKARC